MDKIEREQKLFGTPVITEAWLRAVMRHPVAYLRHRAAFMWNFLAGDNLTMWVADVEHPSQTVFADRPAFAALVFLHDRLKPTPLFRAGGVAAGLHHRVPASAGGGARRPRAPLRWALADRPPSTC